MTLRVSVVVPVYGGHALAALVQRVEASLLATHSGEFEIVLVEDASPDPAVQSEVARLGSAHARVRCVHLARNVGQHAATMCGLAESRGEIVVTMDEDLEHRPEDVPALVEAVERHDVALARFTSDHHSPVRRALGFGKQLAARIVLVKPWHVTLSSFRAMRRPVALGMLEREGPRPWIPALLFGVTRDVVNVPLEHGVRATPGSTYTWGKLARLGFDILRHGGPRLQRFLSLAALMAAAVAIATRLGLPPSGIRAGIELSAWAAAVTSSVGAAVAARDERAAGAAARPSWVVRERCGA